MIKSEENFKKLLENLLDEIGIRPELPLKTEIDANIYTGERQKKTKKMTSSVQDSVDDLRVCMKYLLFDLDATRRENLYYKRLLESKDF